MIIQDEIKENTVNCGDCMELLQKVKDSTISLIYIDPPFNTGKIQKRTRTKNGKILEDKSNLSYNDKIENYEDFLMQRIKLALPKLKDNGSIFVHLNQKEVHYIKVALDNLLGRDHFMNEIIYSWDYGARNKKKWSNKHDNILWYVKDPKNYIFNFDKMDRIPYKSPDLIRNTAKNAEEKIAKGKTVTDCWEIGIVHTMSKENHKYPTQKPLKLLERIIKVHTNPGDFVMDFFAGCYDSKTEVLTSNGWKSFSSLHKKDKICSLNPENNNIEYVNFVSKIEKKYTGDMLHYKGRSVDLFVTPDHKIYTKEYRNNYFDLISAKNMTYYTFHQKADAIWCKKSNESKSWLNFLGFWFGDGYKEKNNKYRIGFNVSKKKSSFIMGVLKELCIDFHLYERDDNCISLKFSNKEIYNQLPNEKTLEKRIPKWIFDLSSENIWDFVYGFIQADGHTRKKDNRVSMYSNNKMLIDDLQILLLKCGRYGTISTREPRKSFIKGRLVSSKNKSYILQVHKIGKNLQLTQKHKNTVHYSGQVHCVSLEKNHIMYVRRNGKPIWCGNSGTSAVAAAKLGRKYVAMDRNPDAVSIINRRLDEIC